MEDQKIMRKFNRQARLYEKEREYQLLSTWRKKLIPFAHGNVLELAVGAGGNFPYYSRDVHVTALDISQNMLKKAEEGARFAQMDATFILGNAETIHFPNRQFDTVVSTLSFCGYDNPLRMLERVNDWCKPGGTISLLEHGISSNEWIASLQKVFEPLAKRLIGCHQHTPIIEYINKSPLEIVYHEAHLQGIFHLIRAKAT